MAYEFSTVTLDWPATIVLVGESERLRTALSALVEGQDDASVVSFRSAREAARSLEEGDDVDVLVSTQSVDDGDGVELLRHVRQQYPDLPFVLAGEDVTLSDEREAIDAGATDVVRLDTDGPSGDAVLQARIERILERAKPQGPLSGAKEDESGRLLGGAHATIRDLFDATSQQAVAEVVVEAATSALQLSHAAVYLFDQEDQCLHRIASVPDDGSATDAASAGQGTVLWDTYVTGDPHTVGDESSRTDGQTNQETVTIPIGEFGVLRVGADAPIDEGIRERLTNLSTAATAAFEHVERVQSIQYQEQELDERSARIERRTVLTDVLLRIERATIEAESREELERRVCDELIASDLFEFVRIGTVVPQDDRVESQTWAGSERGYLDAIDLELDDNVDEPAVRAAQTRSPVVVNDVTAGLREDTWREEALARGFQSILSVPLARDDRVWGTLTVHAADPDAFDESVRQMVGDIADAVTCGIGVLERKRALLSDTVIDLELTLTDGTDVFSRVARETGARLSFEGVLARDTGAVLFLSVTDAAPSAVEAAFDEAPLVETVDHVPHGDGELFEIELQSVSLVSEIIEEGGTLRALTADGDTTKLQVSLPAETDVRGFIATLERVSPDVRLHSRTQRTRSSRSDQPFRVAYEQRLTDRQLEALRTALLSGYFEWPREHTAEEVAGLLGISQPTFNRHLRVALKKLLVLLFDVDEQQ